MLGFFIMSTYNFRMKRKRCGGSGECFRVIPVRRQSWVCTQTCQVHTHACSPQAYLDHQGGHTW